MKMVVFLFIFLPLGILSLLLWAASPLSLHEKTVLHEVQYVEPEGMVTTEEHPSVIKVLTWNLGFLYGKGSEGPGYDAATAEFYKAKMDKLVESLKDWQPDIVCLQEIDFSSARSHHVNQAQEIAKRAGYPYIAEAPSWEAKYIPFPYWPLSRNFGAMKSGGAILSKYPILDHQVVLLEKPMSQPWWYNLFYLHRYFQKITLQLGDKKFKLINLHLEAFDKKDRKKQIKKLAEIVAQEHVDFVAGDFNFLPKSATKKSKFENADNYESDSSYQVMMDSGLLDVVPDDIYALNESTYFTFPAWKPDRKLDYIFYRPGLKLMQAEVLWSDVSDHLPFKSSFQIAAPKVNPYSL